MTPHCLTSARSGTTFIVLDCLPSDPDALGAEVTGAILFAPAAAHDERERWEERGVQLVTAPDLTTHERDAEAKRRATETMEAVWKVELAGSALGDAFVHRDVRLGDVAHAHLVSALVNALNRVIALDDFLAERHVDTVTLPRMHGPWSRVASELAAVRGLRVARLPNTPPREPLWPPTRRIFTQWLPDALRRWKLRREAARATRELVERYTASNGQPAGPTDIFAFGHYIAESKAVVPIARRILAEGRYTLALVADEWGRGAEAWTKADLSFAVVQELGQWEGSADRVRRAMKTFGSQWLRFLSSAEATSARLVHRGVPIIRAVKEDWSAFGEESVRHDCLRQYLWWIEILYRAVEHWSPRMILLTDEAMPVNRIQLEIAGRLGIRTLSFQHGAIPDHPKHTAAKATCVCVGGDAIRRYFFERGTEPSRIVAVGIPQFDPLADQDALAVAPVRREFGIPEDTPLVVYTMLSGQGVTPRDDVIATTNEVIAARRQFGDEIAFVFKRHPADRGDILRQMSVDPEAERILVTLDAPIHPLLRHADVVIAQMSTTGQEALMIGRPLIIVNLSGRPDSIPFVEYGAAIGVYAAGDLPDAIRRALSDDETRLLLAKGRKRFVEDFLFRVDGRATERIVGEIGRLLDE